MKAKSIKSYITIAAITVAGLSSCKKENIQPVKQVTAKESLEVVAVDQAIRNGLAYQTLNIALAAISDNMGSFKNESSDNFLASCAVVTKDTSVFPHTINVDFGSGCTLDNGATVSGTISGTYTGGKIKSTPGAQATLDFTNFHVNGNQVLGLMSFENLGTNGNSNAVISMDMTNGSMIYGSDGRQIRQNLQWEVELITNGTPQKEDDTYSFTGTADGVTSNGDAYTDQITVPLIISRDPACVKQFISGTTVAQIANNPDLTIDYGTGACDTEASATQNGSTVRIQLANY